MTFLETFILIFLYMVGFIVIGIISAILVFVFDFTGYPDWTQLNDKEKGDGLSMILFYDLIANFLELSGNLYSFLNVFIVVSSTIIVLLIFKSLMPIILKWIIGYFFFIS